MEYPELHASTNAHLRELLLQFDITNDDIEGTGVNGAITKMDRIRVIVHLLDARYKNNVHLYKHTKVDFVNWSIQISKCNILIFNHDGKQMASKRVNTSTLKPTFQYTIFILNGTVSLWVEPGYNPPFYTNIDDVVDDSLSFYNTPVPHRTYGRTPGHSGRKVEPHRCHFV